MSVLGMLRSHREVWRPSTSADGMGGRVTTFALIGEVRCKVDLPSAEERESAMRWGAEVTHHVFFTPSTDVRRGDELRGGDLVLRVLSVVGPSSPRYRKALCAAEQPEG